MVSSWLLCYLLPPFFFQSLCPCSSFSCRYRKFPAEQKGVRQLCSRVPLLHLWHVEVKLLWYPLPQKSEPLTWFLATILKWRIVIKHSYTFWFQRGLAKCIITWLFHLYHLGLKMPTVSECNHWRSLIAFLALSNLSSFSVGCT